MTDEQILEMIRRPESMEKGFRLLVETHQERLYWLIRRMIPDHEEANDVLQDTFVKVYRNIDHFEGKSALYTWLYRIATNESLSFLQKKKRMRSGSLEHADGSEMQLAAEPYMDATGLRKLLDQAIELLPDKQKLVFQLRYFEEMNYQAMSEILETSVGALKASYHHAVKKIESFVTQHNT